MKIGITQRVELDPITGEVRDCIDQNWQYLSSKIDLNLIQIPNKHVDINLWIRDLGIKGFILSGGNDLGVLKNPLNASRERDFTENIILNLAKKQNLPVFGICRGSQMINHFFGGNLIPLEGHIGNDHQIKFLLSDGVTLERNVNSYHRWGINNKSLGKNLIPFAWDNKGNIEAFMHSELPWKGIMWHPERMTDFEDFDRKMIVDLFSK